MEKSDRRKIIIIENSIGITGGFKAILQSTIDLKTHFEFIFVIPKGASSIRLELEKQKFKVYEIDFVYINKKFKTLFSFIPYLLWNTYQLKKIVKKEKATIIHSNDIYNLTPIVYKIFNKKKKLIVHVRLLETAFPKPIFNTWKFLIEKYADIIIGVSQAAMTPFKQKATIVYDRTPLKEKYPYSYLATNEEGNISIFYLANYIRGKGQEAALQVFKTAQAHIPNLKLTFAGSDLGLDKNKKFKQSLIDTAKFLNIEQNIEFKDFIEDIENEFKKHQIYLNLSNLESFSFTVLEALYFGIPCITNASGGPQEILENGKYGILVYNKDLSLASNAIIKLAENIELRKNLSIEGRRFVREKFSLNNTSKKLLNIYDNFYS